LAVTVYDEVFLNTVGAMCLPIKMALKAKSTYIERDVSAFSVAPHSGVFSNQFIEKLRRIGSLGEKNIKL
jgi:hypothetical protein